MRYQGRVEPKGTNHTDRTSVHAFVMGSNEARLLRDLLLEYMKHTAGIFEVGPSYQRAKNMKRIFEEVLRGGKQERTPKFKKPQF